MTVSIYASRLEDDNVIGPVFDFAEGTSIDVTIGSAAFIFKKLGLDIGNEDSFDTPIDDFISRGLAFLEKIGLDRIEIAREQRRCAVANGQFSFDPCDPVYVMVRVDEVVKLAIAGKEAGATMMTVA